MLQELYKLQNGTDIRGIAITNLEKEVTLTTERVRHIIRAFVKWLKNKKSIQNEEIKIAIGMDSRLSGPEFKECICDELLNLGCFVYDCGLCTTPAMFMTTVIDNYKCHGSIMITGSHLPYYYNGLKFFTEDGGCEKEDIKYILTNAVENCDNNLCSKGRISKINFIDEYSRILVEKIRQGINSKVNYNKPLLGFKIIVDAGNGAGGFFTNKVLEPLGAETKGSQFIIPDGRFPNHVPNPEAREAMHSVKNAVIENKADLGIIFDADVDRAGIVDSKGREINRNALIALISSIVLEEHPNTIIVTDSVTSNGLSQFIEKLGGKHHRFKRGYRNVINEGMRLNNESEKCYLAIETSGHGALKENYFLDDGAYLIAKILIKMARLSSEGKGIENLIEDLKVPFESLEFRFNISNSNFKEYGYEILNNLKSHIKEAEGWSMASNNYEGVRVNCCRANGDGWFLLRLSLHEPVLCLNIECDSQGSSNTIIDRLKSFLINYKELDSKSLKESSNTK
ncbi:phosphomannomutase/phosphoglucomutase [Clostridium sp. WILCCON 0269]|uniref:Phosphomannomutase/phosphoglucomutase n=1 Tax=Candidatus Clostridium eludens TaxID=3381663 RepID=A0ABW8SPN7_9CLOT